MADMPVPAETSSIDTGLPSRFAIESRHAETRCWQAVSHDPFSQVEPRPSAPANVYIVPYWSAFTSEVPFISAHFAMYLTMLRLTELVISPLLLARPLI